MSDKDDDDVPPIFIAMDPAETQRTLRNLIQMATQIAGEGNPALQIKIAISHLQEADRFLQDGYNLNAQMLVLSALQALTGAAYQIAQAVIDDSGIGEKTPDGIPAN